MTSKGHIYMIWTPLDNSFCYIGSTFNRLHKRFQEHKSKYKLKYGNFSIHKYFDIYGVDNFKIDLIKTYNVIRTHQKDCKHLHAYETLWINKTKNCINSQLPFNPIFNNKDYQKKYREENKDKIKDYQKNYQKENKDTINEQKKNYRKIKKFNCECGGKYRVDSKARHLKTKKHINYIANLDNTI